ncbi:MAG TPA: hypothetical protein VGK76_03085 [Candidatus Eisenbacteria bacterium]|jgi:hypothetical protein
MNHRRWKSPVMTCRHRRALAGLSATVLAMALAGGAAAKSPPARRAPRAASSPREAVEGMLTRVLRAPEIHSRVVIRRSDPFGGPDERTSGRIWFLPGRGLRFRSEERGGEEIVVDREKGAFLVFRPSEKVLYRAGWDRAPARMRQLITEPERVLDSGFQAVAERRLTGGVLRDGYRVRRGALADSGSNVSVWIAADPGTGLPRWVSAAGDEDSVEVEFRSLAILSKANPRDLSLNLPREVRTEPLDPRELLPGSESR